MNSKWNLIKSELSAPIQFNLLYAPHFGMFENIAGLDLIDQIIFMSEMGFRAIEDNKLLKRNLDVQNKIGNALEKYEMKMGVFVLDCGDNWKVSLTSGKEEYNLNFLKVCRDSIEVAKRCNAKFITVVLGYFDRYLPIGIQTANVINVLKKAVEIFEPHGITIVLEPLSDNPECFLRTSDQAYQICKAVGSAYCKILFDIWHLQKNEGRLLYHLDLCWDEIGYFQVADEPGRTEPTTGEINYRNIFKYIYDKSCEEKKEFILGMEHRSSVADLEGEIKIIKAYQWCDKFNHELF